MRLVEGLGLSDGADASAGGLRLAVERAPAETGPTSRRPIGDDKGGLLAVKGGTVGEANQSPTTSHPPCEPRLLRMPQAATLKPMMQRAIRG